MEPIEGRPVLAHVLARCAEIAGSDTVVCAVPDQPESAAARNRSRRLRRAGLSRLGDRRARPLSRRRADGGRRCRHARHVGLSADRSRDLRRGARPARTPRTPTTRPTTCRAAIRTGSTARPSPPRRSPRPTERRREPYDREHVTPWLRRAPHLKRANLASGDAVAGSVTAGPSTTPRTSSSSVPCSRRCRRGAAV